MADLREQLIQAADQARALWESTGNDAACYLERDLRMLSERALAAQPAPAVGDEKLTAYVEGWNARGAFERAQPAPAAAAVPEGWKAQAAAWLEGKAQEQEANNARWPQHAAAYDLWRHRVGLYRDLASQLLSAAPQPATCNRPLQVQPEAKAGADDDWHLRGYAYASKQATKCAGCGQHKHTPLRIDAMGGYVCLTCIDQKLGSLLGEFGYPEPKPAKAGADDEIEITPEMDAAGFNACEIPPGTDDFPTGTDARRAIYRAMYAASKPKPAEGGADEVCAQAYQVVGSLLSDVGAFNTDHARKILDNLSQARVVHDDVLPWPSFSPAGSGEAVAWQYMLGGQWHTVASDEPWRSKGMPLRALYAGPAADAEMREDAMALAKYIIDHPHAAKGMGLEPHGQWQEMQRMARRLAGGGGA